MQRRLFLKSVPIVAFGAIAITLAISADASAGIINDLPRAINKALFDDSNLTAAKALLAGGVLAALGAFVAVCRLNTVGTAILMIGMIGVLTAVGWLDYWLLILAALVVVALFAGRMADYISGHNKGGAE